MYFTRGYTFHTYEYGRQRATSNYGICVKGETDFYGILTEIIEVEFPGILKLKCVLFKCEWFDPVVNRGVRFNKFGVVDVNSGRRYNKFEPFILASQADQVSFLSYPRNHEYEDLTDDATDEVVEDEFNENDDVSSDDENVDVSD
ncbi:hypothetical protein Bca101_011186 [Brassica carinata]